MQQLHLYDWPQRDAIYQIEFNDSELQSNETFCKGISKTITGGLNNVSRHMNAINFCFFVSIETGISGAFIARDINPELIQALKNIA